MQTSRLPVEAASGTVTPPGESDKTVAARKLIPSRPIGQRLFKRPSEMRKSPPPGINGTLLAPGSSPMSSSMSSSGSKLHRGGGGVGSLASPSLPRPPRTMEVVERRTPGYAEHGYVSVNCRILVNLDDGGYGLEELGGGTKDNDTDDGIILTTGHMGRSGSYVLLGLGTEEPQQFDFDSVCDTTTNPRADSSKYLFNTLRMAQIVDGVLRGENAVVVLLADRSISHSHRTIIMAEVEDDGAGDDDGEEVTCTTAPTLLALTLEDLFAKLALGVDGGYSAIGEMTTVSMSLAAISGELTDDPKTIRSVDVLRTSQLQPTSPNRSDSTSATSATTPQPPVRRRMSILRQPSAGALRTLSEEQPTTSAPAVPLRVRRNARGLIVVDDATFTPIDNATEARALAQTAIRRFYSSSNDSTSTHHLVCSLAVERLAANEHGRSDEEGDIGVVGFLTLTFLILPSSSPFNDPDQPTPSLPSSPLSGVDSITCMTNWASPMRLLLKDAFSGSAATSICWSVSANVKDSHATSLSLYHATSLRSIASRPAVSHIVRQAIRRPTTNTPHIDAQVSRRAPTQQPHTNTCARTTKKLSPSPKSPIRGGGASSTRSLLLGSSSSCPSMRSAEAGDGLPAVAAAAVAPSNSSPSSHASQKSSSSGNFGRGRGQHGASRTSRTRTPSTGGSGDGTTTHLRRGKGRRSTSEPGAGAPPSPSSVSTTDLRPRLSTSTSAVAATEDRCISSGSTEHRGVKRGQGVGGQASSDEAKGAPEEDLSAFLYG